MRFEVTGRNKAEVERQAKAVIQRFMGEPADPIDMTMSVEPPGHDSDLQDEWWATVHYEW